MKLGIVPYLNAAPLVADLPRTTQVRAAVPSLLSTWLESGEVDAALLPVAEAVRGVGGGFVGRFGIASDGPVESVLAFLPKTAPPAAWPRDVVLDPASRTSVALLRVLLERRYGLAPRYRTAPEAGPNPLANRDAITLVIGDKAIERARTWTGGVLDLGREWKEWTGLPFVFARWTARRGLLPNERDAVARVVDDAARAGLARVEAIAKAEGPAHGLAPADAVRYLTRSVRFAIDERAEAGLARFAREIETIEGAVA